MKELAVIAVLIVLGYGTESSLVYVLGESYRVFEELPHEYNGNPSVAVAAVIPTGPMNWSYSGPPARHPLVPSKSQAGNLRQMDRSSESNTLLKKSNNTSQVALLAPDLN